MSALYSALAAIVRRSAMDSNATESAGDNNSLVDDRETNSTATSKMSQRAPDGSHDVEKPTLPAELVRQIAVYLSLADLRSLAATCQAFNELLDDLLQWHTIKLSLDSARWSDIRRAGTAKKIRSLSIYPDSMDQNHPENQSLDHAELAGLSLMPHLERFSWIDQGGSVEWKTLFAAATRSCPNLTEFRALARYSLFDVDNWGYNGFKALPLVDQPLAPLLKRFVAFVATYPATVIEGHRRWSRRMHSVTQVGPLLARCRGLTDITVATWPPPRFEVVGREYGRQGRLILDRLHLPSFQLLIRLEIGGDFLIGDEALISMCEQIRTLEVLLLQPAEPFAEDTADDIATWFNISDEALPNLRVFRGEVGQISAIVAPSSRRQLNRIEGLFLRPDTVIEDRLLEGLSQQHNLKQLSLFLREPPRGINKLKSILTACSRLTALFVGCDEQIRRRSVEELLSCVGDLQQLRKLRLPLQDLIFTPTAVDTGTMTLRTGPRQPSFLSSLRQRVHLFGSRCKNLERIDFGSTAGYAQITRYTNSPSRQVSDVAIEAYTKVMEDGHDGWTGAWRDFWEDGQPSFSPFEADLQQYPELKKPVTSRME